MAGSLPLDDGRYLIRSGPAERVLVIETEGALPPPRRRRRRPRKAVVTDAPIRVAVTVATVILADRQYSSEDEAGQWLERLEDSDFTGELIADATRTLDRARAAEAAASGTPFGTPTRVDGIAAARAGYGDGDQVASGRFLDAVEIDARGGSGSGRREKAARTGSLARSAAILGGRERTAGCEILLPRIRFDLDTGNSAAACLAAEVAVSATIAEMEFAVGGDEHERDLDRLEELLPGLAAVSERAQTGTGDESDLRRVAEALEVAERVIRRRRILDQ